MFGLRPAFPGGVRLPAVERHDSDALIRQMAFAPLLRLPLRQHAGAASVAVVQPGDEVMRGQLLARAEADTAVPLHAPATGRVVRISAQPDGDGAAVGVIELAPAAGDTQEEITGRPLDPARCSPDELLRAIGDAGLVGLGGEAGSTHERLVRARAGGARVVVINGIEGEPGQARVPALLLRHGPDVIQGLRMVLRVLQTERSLLAVESHDGEAAGKLVQTVGADCGLTLRVLPPRYPQGAAGLLLRSLASNGADLNRAEAVVFSLATIAEIGRLLSRGWVMTDQLLTLSGDGLDKPGNYRVPLGTPIAFALAEAGARGDVERVLLGGPMRGKAVAGLERPIVKATTGLVAVAAGSAAGVPEPMACIRCGDCVTACPVRLHPAELGLLARRGENEAMFTDWYLDRCIECGCCSYVCPSHIPLVQMFRAARLQQRRLQRLAGEEVPA